MTISLQAGQTLEGVAGTASAVTYTVTGDEADTGDAFRVLAQGQLADTPAVLGTVGVGVAWIVKNIQLANTTGSVVSGVQLFVGGDANTNLIVSLEIPAGGTAVYDGAWHVYDSSGNQTATTLVMAAENVTFDPAAGIAATDVQGAVEEVAGDVTTVSDGLAAHLADTTDAHDASAISNVAAGGISATDVQAALNELDGDKATTGSVTTVANDLAAHIADTSDAHDASAISNVAAGTISATDVQGALNELDTEKATTGSVSTVATNLANHIGDTSDAHDASAISSVPAGNLAATDVQAALDELDTEKAAVSEPIAAAHIADAADAHAGTAITNTPAGNIAATTVQGAINELDTEKASTAYADALVIDSIADSDTTHAPSRNAVFDALALKAPLASPALTGTPTAPTATPGDNDTSIATTAFVTAADTALLAATITNADTTHAPTGDAVFDALALKADLASPALTGNPTAPTQSAGTNNTRLATTAYADALVADAINNGTTGIAPSQNAVFDALALKAPLTPTVGSGLGTTGSVALDFDALNGTFQTIALSGNITFTTSNLSPGESVTLFISAASLRTFTFPAWIFVGTVAPASIAAGKSGVLTLTSTTTADSGVYAAWAAQP